MSALELGAAPAFTRYDLGISPFWQTATPAEQEAQRSWQSELRQRGAMQFSEDSFISPLAAVYADSLTLGARSYIAAHVCLWGNHELGADCTLNPFSELRGRVRLGDGVRVGAHTSILGFNHAMSTLAPIHEQPLVSEGITIGDDVWIGSHVVIVDGVRIGAHSIIGAGSVVTKDVPDWSVVAGNPARRIRDRREARPAASTGLDGRLHTLVGKARAQLDDVVGRCWTPAGAVEATSYAGTSASGTYRDSPGEPPTLRAWADAVELYDLLRGSAPTQTSKGTIVDVFRRGQDPDTGLTPELHLQGEPANAVPSADGHAAVNYHILSAGYALDLVGSRFEHPIRSFHELSSADLTNCLAELPWRREGWKAGAWVDAAGTAYFRNAKDFGLYGELETLFGWLTLHCDPATGLWGKADPRSGLLEPINGFYRLTRGTYAQFGVPLPYPERTIDSVLAHAADANYFGPDKGTACNVLDVIHPLWLAAKQTNHRRSAGQDWAKQQLERALGSWNEGAGFSFTLQHGYGPHRIPGLLGTEMWLSIIWLLADYLGIEEALGYRPRGVHRPEPAHTVESRLW
ncbi:2,3,4,5-tetrahydropyridine-2,6-dicarboxylate N-acetyltransferase [compost metagenome]